MKCVCYFPYKHYAAGFKYSCKYNPGYPHLIMVKDETWNKLADEIHIWKFDKHFVLDDPRDIVKHRIRRDEYERSQEDTRVIRR